MINNYNLYNEDISKAISFNDMGLLKNKSIMITGANGLIGSAIIDILNYLNENQNFNIKIYALVRNKLLERLSKFKNIVEIRQDVTQEINCDEKIDFVIHAASNSDPKLYSSDPVGTMLSNILGIKNVLDYAIKNVKERVLYISTDEVYGKLDTGHDRHFEEDTGKHDSHNIRSGYPLSKLASECLLESYISQYGIEGIIVRPCHIYGPTQTEKDSRASSAFLRNGVNGQNIIMKSSGSQVRSYTYVIDAATGILVALIKGANGEIYNVANNDSIISIKGFADLVAQNSNTNVILEMASNEEKKSFNNDEKQITDGTKLESIGWKPVFSIEQGIKKSIEIMK